MSEDALALLAPGTMIDHFRVMRLAGRGSYAVVYLARDTKLGRKAALKIYSPKVAVAKEAVAQFLIEARATASFSHPHIVTVYGVGELEGRPYVALEYLEGRTLRQRLNEDPPSIKESLRFLLAIALALQEAHARKILHRDLKPENIIIPRDGRIRVVDFGLATVTGPPARDPDGDDTTAQLLTELFETQHEAWRAVGTPAYMAPEQWTARECTEATDIWALGVLFHELIVGRRPFHGATREELGRMVIGSSPPPQIPVSAHMPRELVELADRALDRLPGYRPAAKEFVAALEAALYPSRAISGGEKSPFRGLLTFSERHADIFFGRDAEVISFLERLRDRPVLPVIGPSGAGKSSFVQAGVIPQLRDQGRWIVLRMRPGYRPFDAVAHRLLEPEGAAAMATSMPRTDSRSDPHFGSTGDSAILAASLAAGEASFEGPQQVEIARLADRLRGAPHVLGQELRALAERENARVLLFVDQLEELHTLTVDAGDRSRFIDALCTAADDAMDPVRVVFTLRDDFVGRLAGGEKAGEVFGSSVILRAPDETAFREILTRPLALTEYRYEDENIPLDMIAEVAGEPAALPILQFACQSLWDRRDRARKLLLRASYRASGGVAGALAAHADGILASMTTEQRKIARQIFLRLITPERTRRILAESRVLEGLTGAREVLDRLVGARLLTTRRSRTDPEDRSEGEADLELAHESMVDTWQTLSRWIEESKDELAFLAQIGQAAELWEKRGCPADEVWHGDALANARVELAKLSTPIPPRVARFVAAGEAQRRRDAWSRRALTAAAFLIVSFAAITFYSGKQTADAERRVAELRRAEALREGAESALARGEVWEARAKIRTSLEIADSSEARALWIHLSEARTIWRTILPFASSLAFSPDGQSLLVQAEERDLHLIDTRSFGKKFVRGLKEGAYCFAYSPQGKYLALGAGSGEIEVRDLQRGTSVTLSGHRSAIQNLAFSPDERFLISASWDQTARLWSMPAGTAAGVLEGHRDRVYGLAFAEEGELIATSSWDKTIRLWKASSSAELGRIEAPDKVVDVALSRDGKLLAAASEDGTILLADPRSLAVLRTLRGHMARVSRVIFHPDGAHLFSSSWDGTVRVWSVALGRELSVVAEHASIVQAMALDPAGSTFVSLSHDGELRISRAGSPDQKSIPLRGPLPGVALDPLGKRVASTAPGHAIALWDAKSGALERLITGHTNTLRTLAFGPEGRILASGGFDATVRLWDPETGAIRRVLMGHTRPIAALDFFPDGGRVVSAAFDHTVRVWDTASGAQLAVIDHGARLTSVAVGADGALLAAGGFDGVITLVDVARRIVPVKRLVCGTPQIVHQVAFSPAGDLLAALCGSAVRIWTLSGEYPFRELAGAGNSAQNYTCLAFDPAAPAASPRLAHSIDGGAAFTEVASGARVGFTGLRHESVFCEFDRSGSMLATIDDDGAVRLRSGRDGRPSWRAPFMQVSPPLLFSHEGWTALGPGPGPGPRPAEPAWGHALAGAEMAELSADGKYLCGYFEGGGVELWDVTAGARVGVRREIEGVSAIRAFGDACLIEAGGRAILFDRTGSFHTLEEGTTAIAAGAGVAWASTRSSVVRFEGGSRSVESTWSSTTAVVSAIGLSRDRRAVFALGFADGSVRSGLRVLAPFTKAPVSSVVEGPRGVVIAGQADGMVTVRDPTSGALLMQFHLHGPVRHLVMEGERLHVATELASRRTLDLSALAMEYCALLANVWRSAPAVWEAGAAKTSDPSRDHPCAETGSTR